MISSYYWQYNWSVYSLKETLSTYVCVFPRNEFLSNYSWDAAFSYFTFVKCKTFVFSSFEMTLIIQLSELFLSYESSNLTIFVHSCKLHWPHFFLRILVQRHIISFEDFPKALYSLCSITLMKDAISLM